MIWPRAAIVAEIGWSNSARDWPAFSRRLVAAIARWRKLGLNYDATPLEPLAGFQSSGSNLAVTLTQPAGIGMIHYALDDAVSAGSPAYRQPLTLAAGTRLSAQSFLGNSPLGAPRHWTVGPGLLRTRAASEMELCGNAIPLRLEDDGPTFGVRKVHWVDIMHPCWIWRDAPLEGSRRIAAEVGRLPFNFSIGDDIKKISFETPATAAGELRVHRDGCDGPIVAAMSLQAVGATSGDVEIEGPIDGQTGTHDLCMTFTQTGPDPFWVLDRLTLQP
jgi:hexosaminidase